MYLSIATTHSPATDLGFLLFKHPDRVHETELPFGKAIVFYPEASEARCEAALVMEVDPVALVRGRGRGDGLIDHYVNDRPYAASSFLSVALGRTLGTAMTGASRHKPELAEAEIPLEAVVTPLPARGGEALVRALFEPLGWDVGVETVPGPDGEPSAYVTLTLKGTARLVSLLNHLYVLIPVLDDEKHYWVGEDEVEKLMRRGAGWLEDHPAKDLIVRRYLGHRHRLTRAALERLAPETRDEVEPDAPDAPPPREQALEAPLRLNDQRMIAVTEALRAAGATTIADLGCGEGRLLQRLVRERWATKLFGVDPSARELEYAARRLKLDNAAGAAAERVTLLHGSVTYRDRRWEEADAVALVEVIEHLDLDRLPALARTVFGAARPRAVIVTTPNADYNVLFESLPAGAMRHPDHRFEWSRNEFRAWADGVCADHGYTAAFSDIGEVHETLGAATQMAVFTLGGGDSQ